MSDARPPFPGFYSPNSTPIPDQLFDELLAVLPGPDLKVLLYICRRTFGFKKQSDNISLNQMLRGIRRKDGRQLDRGVGLSRPTLLKALRRLEEGGYILARRRGSAQRGNEATNYQLKVAAPTPGQVPLPGGGKDVDHPLVKGVDPQDTDRQQTDNAVDVHGGNGLPTTRAVGGHPVRGLPKLAQPAEKTEYIAREIVGQLGDTQSLNFYRLVAARVPEQAIWEALAQVRAHGADHPARVFTARMGDYARERQRPRRQEEWSRLQQRKAALFSPTARQGSVSGR